MRVLITGGAGFIGSNLVERLVSRNDEIFVIDNLSTGDINNISKYLNYHNFKFINYDITNPGIIKIIKDLNVSEIYNLACPASPKYYLDHPIETWEASVLGVHNLLKSIKGTKIKMFHSSNSEVYGDALQYPQTEEYWGNVNPIGVRSCYDEGKRAAESLIYDYIRKYKVDVRVARIFNTYGPKMKRSDGRVISNLITQALSNNHMTIYGSGEQTRCFCYIDDTLDFIELLMKKQQRNKIPLNVGNPCEQSILSVAEIIKELTDSSADIIFLGAMKDDPKKRKPDISKSSQFLNWVPTTSFKNGLLKTIEFFRNDKKMSDL